jgi:hypothetical protein
MLEVEQGKEGRVEGPPLGPLEDQIKYPQRVPFHGRLKCGETQDQSKYRLVELNVSPYRPLLSGPEPDDCKHHQDKRSKRPVLDRHLAQVDELVDDGLLFEACNP